MMVIRMVFGHIALYTEQGKQLELYTTKGMWNTARNKLCMVLACFIFFCQKNVSCGLTDILGI